MAKKRTLKQKQKQKQSITVNIHNGSTKSSSRRRYNRKRTSGSGGETPMYSMIPPIIIQAPPQLHQTQPSVHHHHNTPQFINEPPVQPRGITEAIETVDTNHISTQTNGDPIRTFVPPIMTDSFNQTDELNPVKIRKPRSDKGFSRPRPILEVVPQSEESFRITQTGVSTEKPRLSSRERKMIDDSNRKMSIDELRSETKNAFPMNDDSNSNISDITNSIHSQKPTASSLSRSNALPVSKYASEKPALGKTRSKRVPIAIANIQSPDNSFNGMTPLNVLLEDIEQRHGSGNKTSLRSHSSIRTVTSRMGTPPKSSTTNPYILSNSPNTWNNNL